tara:strand:+ start:6 stop:749 length:744 start_codon:yes stop_codon:yes gene_type:complete
MLKLNHLTGFGSGAAGGAAADVTSYDFDGTDDAVKADDHADWNFTQGDFTIECFIYLTNASSAISAEIFNHWTGASINSDRFFLENNSGMSYIVTESSAQAVVVRSTTSLFSDATWHHIAICRDGNNYYTYLDGVDRTTSGSPDATNPVDKTGEAWFGDRPDGTASFDGRIDEYRISNTCRYPSGTTFTPTITQFESDANTLVLIHSGETIVSGATGSGATFVDSGNTGHTWTEVGNAIRDTTVYKF